MPKGGGRQAGRKHPKPQEPRLLVPYKNRLTKLWPKLIGTLVKLVENRNITADEWIDYIKLAEGFDECRGDAIGPSRALVMEKLREDFQPYTAGITLAINENPQRILAFHEEIWYRSTDGFLQWSARYNDAKRLYCHDPDSIDLRFPTLHFIFLYLWEVTTHPYREKIYEAVTNMYKVRSVDGVMIFHTITVFETYKDMRDEIDVFIKRVDEIMIDLFVNGLDRTKGRLWRYPAVLQHWLTWRIPKSDYLVEKLLVYENVLFFDAISFILRCNFDDLYYLTEVIRRDENLDRSFRQTLTREKNKQIVAYVFRNNSPASRLWAFITICNSLTQLDIQLVEKSAYMMDLRASLFKNIPKHVLDAIVIADYPNIRHLTPPLAARELHALIYSLYVRCKTLDFIERAHPEHKALKNSVQSVWRATMDDPVVKLMEVKPKSYHSEHLSKFLGSYVDAMFRSEVYRNLRFRKVVGENIFMVSYTAQKLDRKRFLKLCHFYTRERLLQGFCNDLVDERGDMFRSMSMAIKKEPASFMYFNLMYIDIYKSLQLERMFYLEDVGLSLEELACAKFGFRVLNTHAWYHDDVQKANYDQITLPDEILDAQEDFGTFYLEKCVGRTMRWTPMLSFGLVAFHANKRTFDLWVSAAQLSILLSFDDKIPDQKKSFVDIMRDTEIKILHLKKVLANLVLARNHNLVICEPPLESKADIMKPHYRFSINYDMTAGKDGQTLGDKPVIMFKNLWTNKPDMSDDIAS